MNKSYREYLDAVNDIMEFFNSDECKRDGESYWISKSGENLSLDCGYFWEGLEAFRAYFRKKIDEESGHALKFPIQVKCRWCNQVFRIERDSDAYQEYRPDYVGGQDVDKWIWRARCPKCKGNTPVKEVQANE